MKVRLKFVGFPEVESAIGGKEINLEFEGHTYGDLLTYLKNTYGKFIMKTLRLQVLRNGKEWIKRDDLAYSFQDGDQLTFLRMVSGG